MISQVEQAAFNNAYWCNAVCRAHGIPGEFHKHMWLNRGQVPPFYPNVVTLSGNEGMVEQLTLIQELKGHNITGSLGVKDSFCTLDLAPSGFHLLFEAHWLWRAPSQPCTESAVPGIKWAVVGDQAELTRWELAWNNLTDHSSSVPLVRIFLPSLLTDTDIAFIAAYQNEDIVAGAIANRTSGVVGLSNVFVRHDDPTRFWAGCLAKIIDIFPGLPVVDYGSGNDLVIAQSLGFNEMGPLRIWVLDR
jgi:hypothetical protein